MQARRKINDHLFFEIRSGKLKTGQRMPTEKQIAQTFNVCCSTVQAVMSQLANKGIVHRHAGHGTFAGRIDNDMQPKVSLDIHNIQPFESEAAVAGDRVTYN